MDILDQMLQRLVDTGTFGKVGFDFDLVRMEQKAIVGQSSAWVLDISSYPEQNSRDTGSPLQVERQVYGVIIGVKSFNDPQGRQARQQLRPLRESVRQAFFGWQVPGYNTFTLAGSERLAFTGDALWYVERFETKRIISTETLL